MVVNFNYPADPSVNLDDINWYTEWFCDNYRENKALRLEKGQHTREVDEQTGKTTWYALVDTNLTGRGKLLMRLWADIPDTTRPEGVRPEYAEIDTGQPIY